MSAWPTAASRRLELFSAFSGNPDEFVCLVYIALHCLAICKRDQCWLPIFQSLWHHHHLIPIMGGKKPLPSSSCWVWEGQWGTLCACTLNQQDERYWHSHDIALLGQDTTSNPFPGFSWVPIPTVSAAAFLYQDDHGFPGISKMARVTFPDWLHVFVMSAPHCPTPHPAGSKWADARLSENRKVTLEILATFACFSFAFQPVLQCDEHVLRCLLPHIQGGQTSTDCQISPKLLWFCACSSAVNILSTTISGLVFWSCWAPTSRIDIMYRFSLLSFFHQSFHSSLLILLLP